MLPKFCYHIYHNFIRDHEAFDGKTPADIASIKIEGQNKWITLIQNASEKKLANHLTDQLSRYYEHNNKKVNEI
jgi:hypothetical protein